MANHKSAEKRARQTIKRNSRNTQARAAVKTYEKNLVAALESKANNAGELLKEFTGKIMSAASKGVIKRETAYRKIGRLSARVHQATGK